MTFPVPLPNSFWHEHVYRNLCVNYFHKNKNGTVPSIEYILFLVQYKTIVEGLEPLFDEAIYFYENEVRIRFISDCIRTIPKESNAGAGHDGQFKLNLTMEFEKMARAYYGMSEIDLENKVNEIISVGALPYTYFIHKKYRNSLSRLQARTFANRLRHPIKSLFKFMLFFFALISWGCLFVSLILCIMAFISSSEATSILFYEYALTVFVDGLLLLPILILWIKWTLQWWKPTQYEKDECYVEE